MAGGSLGYQQKVFLHCISLFDFSGLLFDNAPNRFFWAVNHLPADSVDDVVPNKIYSKKELLDYLRFTREKCHSLIKELTEEKINEPWISGSGNMNLELSGADALHYSVLDILFYNMKHVQHHAAQLNLILRQTINNAPDYVPTAEDDL